ncbi:MAG: hypothetical protein GY798_07135 [Hyphomicrobiales bacterium]|nr:hypothetical protein [Hyphomicrobiales bacterium]
MVFSAIVILALSVVGHLQAYTGSHATEPVKALSDEAVHLQTGADKDCDGSAVTVEPNCRTGPGAEALVHGIGSSCSFFAVAIDAGLPAPWFSDQSVCWITTAWPAKTATIEPILRPPISVS